MRKSYAAAISPYLFLKVVIPRKPSTNFYKTVDQFSFDFNKDYPLGFFCALCVTPPARTAPPNDNRKSLTRFDRLSGGLLTGACPSDLIAHLHASIRSHKLRSNRKNEPERFDRLFACRDLIAASLSDLIAHL